MWCWTNWKRKGYTCETSNIYEFKWESVRAVMDFYKLDPTKDIIVIADDISLPTGKIRIRAKGSAGGHNGLKSIIAHAGTDQFTRIKVGVGANQGDLVKHVLGKIFKG